nr:MAG TPA: hypothetical protein [Microviridae sp.]
MKDPNVRFFGMPTERMPSKAGSEMAPTWKAVKRANGTTEYIEQPPENVYEKIQRAGEGYDLASAIARLEAGDVSIKAKSMVYTEGTPLENMPKDVVTIHEKAQAAAETLEQLKQEEKKKEVSENKPER